MAEKDGTGTGTVYFYTQLTTALMLVVALAWNDAIKSLFELYPKLKKYGPWVYAIFVTIIVSIFLKIIYYIQNDDLTSLFNK